MLSWCRGSNGLYGEHWWVIITVIIGAFRFSIRLKFRAQIPLICKSIIAPLCPVIIQPHVKVVLITNRGMNLETVAFLPVEYIRTLLSWSLAGTYIVHVFLWL